MEQNWSRIIGRNDLIGGDLEFFIPPCGVIRGPITDIQVKPTGFLRIYLAWAAEKILYMPIPWVGLENLQTTGLAGEWQKWMDKGKIDVSDNRLIFDNGRTINLFVGTGWLGIIHPKGKSKLEPCKVAGLHLE